MEINDELKSALLADVENVCELNLKEETKTALARCFEITIGTRQQKANIDIENILIDFGLFIHYLAVTPQSLPRYAKEYLSKNPQKGNIDINHPFSGNSGAKMPMIENATNFMQIEPFTREQYLNLDKETLVTLLMNCQKVLEGMNQNNYCTCKNDHYAYGHAVCFDCGKIKECRNHVPVDDPV